MAKDQGDAGSPADEGANVTPDNNTVFGVRTRGILVGTGGILNVRMAGSQNVVRHLCQNGQILPISVDKITVTGPNGDSTATDITIWW